MRLDEYLLSKGPCGPFKPGVIVCPTTGDLSIMWEDLPYYGDSKFEFSGITLYRTFPNREIPACGVGRIIGIRILSEFLSARGEPVKPRPDPNQKLIALIELCLFTFSKYLNTPETRAIREAAEALGIKI